MTKQQLQQLLKDPINMTPLEKAEVGRVRQAYFSAVAQETEAYIAAKEAYDEAKIYLDLEDPGEREVLMTLLKSMRDSERNMAIISAELEVHFGISA
jgi:hypothetical protein